MNVTTNTDSKCRSVVNGLRSEGEMTHGDTPFKIGCVDVMVFIRCLK